MSAFLSGYDLSVLAIPAFYVLSMAPHIFAIRTATQGNMSRWDNRNPRSTTMKAKLQKQLSPDVFARYERYESCHKNGLESLPLFVSAVVLGNLAGLKRDEMSTFAASFLAVRLLYTVVYTTHTTQGMGGLRTGIWYVGSILCFRTIIRAAGALGSRG
ncbi:hypothetical protein ACN47E_005441 [Coniothyrium glycines]